MSRLCLWLDVGLSFKIDLIRPDVGAMISCSRTEFCHEIRWYYTVTNIARLSDTIGKWTEYA